MLEFLAHYIIQLIQSTNYFGIFVLMALESALIPIPSEVTMPFAGFLASKGELNFWLIVLVGTIANLLGSLLAYYIGYLLEETILIGLVRKYGKLLLITMEDYEHANKWFVKYGDKIILISRLLPAIRTVISLPAGVFRMNLKKFVIYTTVGCFVWSVLLTYVGVVLGENWHSLEGYFRKFDLLIIILGMVVVLWYLDKKLKLRSKIRRNS